MEEIKMLNQIVIAGRLTADPIIEKKEGKKINRIIHIIKTLILVKVCLMD